jgi:hypothetical protein
MDVSEIFKKVSNNGLVNPLGKELSKALITITPPELAELTQLAQEQAALTGAAVPDSGQIQAAILAIKTAKTSTENMLSHTNKLSGVDISSDVFTVVAKTMNGAKSITGEKSCANVLAAFGAIQNMAAIVTDTIKSIKLVEEFLLDIPGQIAALPGQLNAYASQLESQIIKDAAALTQARIVITQNAIATHLVTLISDPCVSEIIAGVMTAPLKKEVVKVVDKLKTVQNMRVL